jgi:hypothetical protein
VVDLLLAQGAIDHQRLAHPRVHRAPGILEDGLDVRPVLLQLGTAELAHVLAAKQQRAARQLFEEQDHLGDGRLASTRLADETQRLPRKDPEGNVVDGTYPTDDALDRQALGDGEVLLEVDALEQWLGRHGATSARSAGSATPVTSGALTAGVPARQHAAKCSNSVSSIGGSCSRQRSYTA